MRVLNQGSDIEEAVADALVRPPTDTHTHALYTHRLKPDAHKDNFNIDTVGSSYLHESVCERVHVTLHASVWECVCASQWPLVSPLSNPWFYLLVLQCSQLLGDMRSKVSLFSLLLLIHN